ncbi:HD domain-containing phosphohydrolase [Aliivibrio logei]|nr:HD domain-containing phosphohydrolase [Aliivibrio logei]
MFRSLYFLVTIILCLCNPAIAHSQNDLNKKPINILVLHSYSPSYEWTEKIEEGIKNATATSERNIRLSIEYMDSKRIDGSKYTSQYESYLNGKYNTHYFDAIIVSDDNALNFLIRYGDHLFPSIPIIAVGINNLSVNLSTIEHRTTVFYEKDHITKNLELAQKLYPNLKTVYLLSDNSLTSQLIRRRFIEEAVAFKGLNIKVVSHQSLADAAKLLSEASSDSVAFLTHYNTELSDGHYYDYNTVASKLSQDSQIPIFVFWEHYLGHGVLGGYVNRSYALGVQSVISLTKKLNFTINKQIAGFPKAWEGYVFDNQVINQFNISKSTLPYTSVIVNEPHSYFYENRNIITVTLLLIAMLLGIIITQSIAIRRKKELSENKSHILALQKRTLNVQKEMIEVLGEAIETRSGETGNHVRRVAKMSSLLGKIYGLPKNEYRLLEVISPMHDVGKIGISESILDKPSKLTPAERIVVETHTEIGYKLLMSGDGEIMHSAARIALEHHEHWDGKGYPNQIVGEAIHIFARITAITDVFDALMSKRCYKDAWPLDKVITLFNEECGKQFDPRLCQMFLQEIEQFIAIRREYPD